MNKEHEIGKESFFFRNLINVAEHTLQFSTSIQKLKRIDCQH